jgi:polar amino acid transport system substrate-binding protein
MKLQTTLAGVLLLLTSAAMPAAAQTTDVRVADIVRAGKLRVGLFLPQFGRGPEGLKTTVFVETARAYAAHIGVPLVIVEHQTPTEAVACLKAGACDQLFMARDERAAALAEFSNPVFQFDFTMMVPAGSQIATIADFDKPGVRIAAVRNHASTLALIPQVKQAELVYADTPKQIFDLLRQGKADVMAAPRLALLEFSEQLPGARVLAGRYGGINLRMALPKDKPEWRAYANEFVEEAKASGAVQQFATRGGTRGVTVAPPGDLK